MAIKIQEAARGDAAATGMPGKPEAPNEVANVRSPTHAGHGMNGDPNPVSVTKGRIASPMALNLEATVDDGGVLQAIIQKGSAAMSVSPTGDAVTHADGAVGSQLRNFDPNKNVPDHSSMGSARSRQPTYPGVRETVPAKLGATTGQPVRKPGA